MNLEFWLGIAMIASVVLGVGYVLSRALGGWKDVGKVLLYVIGAALISLWFTAGVSLVVKSVK